MANQLFNRTHVRYEVALDILGAIMSHYSESIAIEMDKDQPDQAVIKSAQASKEALRDVREGLDPNAKDEIEDVISRYGKEARELYVEDRGGIDA